MSSRTDDPQGGEIVDPNTSDLPPEAFEPIDPARGPTIPQLEARIRAKREGAMQDTGELQSPHHADDIEPIAPPPSAEEAPAEEDDEAAADADTEEEEGEQAVEEDDDEQEGEEREADEGDEDDEDFFVGRYKTKEEAERGIQEQHATIARLFQERVERDRQAQQTRQQQGQTVEQPQLDVNAWQEWASEQVEQGVGVQGALAALETGGAQGYDIYIAAWVGSEDPEDRAAAIAFNNEVQRQFAAQTARAAVQPQQQQQDPAATNGVPARQRIAQEFPDFDQLAPEMDRLIGDGPGSLDEGTKRWLTDLASDEAGKQAAWRYLYQVASATRGPAPSSESVKKERQRRKVSADEAKLAATVSSSEGGSTRTPLPAAELAIIRKRNGIREKAGLPLLPEE